MILVGCPARSFWRGSPAYPTNLSKLFNSRSLANRQQPTANSQKCPMPHAPCPMPHAPCPMYKTHGLYAKSS